MGKEAHAPTLRSTPDPTIVAEVIRLADEAEAERYEQRPAEWPTYRGDIDTPARPTPARHALLDYLRHQPDETIAALYALFRTADLVDSDENEAMARYRVNYEIAMRPMHREHGAADLAAKAPLADRLRRGLTLLGRPADPLPSRPAGTLQPTTHPED